MTRVSPPAAGIVVPLRIVAEGTVRVHLSNTHSFWRRGTLSGVDSGGHVSGVSYFFGQLLSLSWERWEKELKNALRLTL